MIADELQEFVNNSGLRFIRRAVLDMSEIDCW
jgi:hypothetical protein